LSATQLYSYDIFIEEEHFLKETLLDESYDMEIIEVMPYDVELADPIYIESPTKPIPTSVILRALPPILFHFFFDLSMSTLLKPKTCVMDNPYLDQTHEHNVTIRLENWVEDLGYMHSLCIYTFYETMSLSSLLKYFGHVCSYYDRA